MKENLVIIPECGFGGITLHNGFYTFLKNFYKNIFIVFHTKNDSNKNIISCYLDKNIKAVYIPFILKKNMNYDLLNIWENLSKDNVNLRYINKLFKEIIKKSKKYYSNSEFLTSLNLKNDNKIIKNLQKNDNVCSQIYCHFRFNMFEISKLSKINRNLNKEETIYNDILNKNNLKDGDKYNIICDMIICKEGINSQKKNLNTNLINNNFININIHNIVDNPFYLFKLLENSEEIHLVEGGIACNLWFLQYSKNLILNKKIYIHNYMRNRSSELLNKDKDRPILNNWIFIN